MRNHNTRVTSWENKTQSNKHDFEKNTTYNQFFCLMKLGTYFRNAYNDRK